MTGAEDAVRQKGRARELCVESLSEDGDPGSGGFLAGSGFGEKDGGSGSEGDERGDGQRVTSEVEPSAVWWLIDLDGRVCRMQPSGNHLGMMQQAGVLVRELQVEFAGLPVGSKPRLEFGVLGGCDFAFELGMDKGFERHDRPSD